MDRSLDEIIGDRPARGVSLHALEYPSSKTDIRHSAAVVEDVVAAKEAIDDQLQREHPVGRSTLGTAFERLEHSDTVGKSLLTSWSGAPSSLFLEMP